MKDERDLLKFASSISMAEVEQVFTQEEGKLLSYVVNVHYSNTLLVQYTHRRRIELEDKAKVIASDWGTASFLH